MRAEARHASLAPSQAMLEAEGRCVAEAWAARAEREGQEAAPRRKAAVLAQETPAAKAIQGSRRARMPSSKLTRETGVRGRGPSLAHEDGVVASSAPLPTMR